MKPIEFIDETGNELDHDRNNVVCKACHRNTDDGAKWEERYCEYCDENGEQGVMHQDITEGSDIEVLCCGRCGFSVHNESKYL